MTCIHGLDEINCPTCRTVKSSLPTNQYKIDLQNNNDLKPFNPLMEEIKRKKEDFVNNLTPNNTRFKFDSINPIPEANILNKIPDFKNKMFSERLGELNIDKSDLFRISKKVTLESPELELKEKK
jgi:hypothetical protein